MSGYRILIWSGAQARLVDHDAIARGEGGLRGEALLERLSAAGRTALGVPLGTHRRPGSALSPASHPRMTRRAKIAALHRHLREALRLLDELRPLPSARRLAARLRARLRGGQPR